MSERTTKPWWRSRRKWWAEEVVRRYGITEHELDQLATYNSERMRGIAHTDAWRDRMAALQARYDANSADGGYCASAGGVGG